MATPYTVQTRKEEEKKKERRKTHINTTSDPDTVYKSKIK